MAIYTSQKNMDLSRDLSDYSDNYSDDEGYSDPDSDIYYGDRFSEEDEKYVPTKQDKQDKIDDDFEQWEAQRPKLQDPDTMEFIRPARKMSPSEEMYREYYDMLDRESRAADEKWAVAMIENFFSLCLKNKRTREAAEHQQWRRNRLAVWKKIHNPPVRSILSLKPLGDFETEYKQMEEQTAHAELIKKGINDRLQSIRAAAEWKITEAKLEKARKKAGKARALAKKGMNKKSAWHRARESNNFVIASKYTISSEPGNGRRVKRKARQEKELEEARKKGAEQAAHEALMEAKREEALVICDEQTQEQETEAAELAEALALINKICIAKAGKMDKFFEEQEVSKKRKAIEEKKENDSWTIIGTAPHKKKGKKIMRLEEFTNQNSLIQQAIQRAVKRRIATDKTYAKRCEAFEELGDKSKLEKVLKFTQMCRSVTQKKKCYHANCRFAHTLEQLVHQDCRFGLSCKFVKAVGNGHYVNQRFGRTGKTCGCYHPGEHERSFCARMGIKHTPKPGEKVQIPKPKIASASVKANTPVKPTESVWAKVVNKAEQKEKVEEAKAKMTKSWNQVVIATLTDEEKKEKYGKGVELLGAVSEERGNVPIIPAVFRKQCDKRGLGFFNEKRTASTKILVTATGFNWVKGVVLAPPKKEHKQCWDVIDPKMVKVFAAVAVINQKIAIEAAKQKAVEINIQLAVKKARAKAVEINQRLQADTGDRKEAKTWTKVEYRGKHSPVKTKIKKSETVIYRVPKDKAELAMLSAIRSGITDFKIVIIEG
jgi:hypothetical protein